MEREWGLANGCVCIVHEYLCVFCECMHDWNSVARHDTGIFMLTKNRAALPLCLSLAPTQATLTHTEKHSEGSLLVYFSSLIEISRKMCNIFSLFTSVCFLSATSLRCFVKWWLWSRLVMWCWRITCRTTSESSSSSLWVRCLPLTLESRRCSHPVCHHSLKEKFAIHLSIICVFTDLFTSFFYDYLLCTLIVAFTSVSKSKTLRYNAIHPHPNTACYNFKLWKKTSLLGFKEFDSESLKLFTNLIYTKFCVRGGENWITAQGSV